MATEWTTLLDWQPSPAVETARFAMVESPTDLSPALAEEDDEAVLEINMIVSYSASENLVGETWTPWPLIRAGDYRTATAATTAVYGGTSRSWVEEGVTGRGLNWWQGFFAKGHNGRPAFYPQSQSLALRRMRIRLLSVSAAPAPAAPAIPQPSAAPGAAPLPAVAPPARRGMGRIAVTNDPNQRILSQIEGVITTIHLRWDDLSGYWYLGVEQGARQVIAGRRITPGLRLLPPAFGWQLVAAPLTDAVVSVGRNAWGQTHALLYVGGGEEISWLR